MGKWRDLFESNLAPVEARDFGEHYVFNPPATAEQITSVEEELGFRLPADVREMLLEFNGILRGTTHCEPFTHYFSTEEMLVDVPAYIRQWEDKALDELARHVVFVCHENGMADLYGVVVTDYAAFRAGEVVMVDHESIGDRECCRKWFGSLAELLRDGPK